MFVGLALGAAVTLVLVGPSVLQPRRPAEANTASASPAATSTDRPVTPAASRVATQATRARVATSTRTATPSPTATPVPPTPTATFVPLATGAPRGQDWRDVALLYNSSQTSVFATNFCMIAQYYGASCERIALDKTELTDAALRDAGGKTFKLIGIGAETLMGNDSLLSSGELQALQKALQTAGVHMLVSTLGPDFPPGGLAQLTGGAILGASRPKDSRRDWKVSADAPEITREFSGQTVTSIQSAAQADFAVTIDRPAETTTLISSQDDAGNAYPIFVRWKGTGGSVFVSAGAPAESMAEHNLYSLYYSAYRFSSIAPLMMTMRYALGDEAWHNSHNYANLTVDDPSLKDPWGAFSYRSLLKELDAHDFHVTIAMPPAQYAETQPAVAALFKANPMRLSVAQHGNNADDYEFYKYTVKDDDEYNGEKLPARPLVDQEADILEGLARMAKHRAQTGVADDRIMIFPWNIAPEQTLTLLKKYNYLATVNGWDTPLDPSHPPSWDHGMYGASMDYVSFPALSRRCFTTMQEFKPQLQYYLFDLFVDKPTLFCTHPYSGDDFGRFGMSAFNTTADQINATWGGVEWRSLGDIVRHLYLEKVEDDGSIEVQFYSNFTIFSNESPEERSYHLTKVETGNVPIKSLTVNGYEFPYKVADGLLVLDVKAPARSSFELRIVYGN
jgi:hypothetical protein